MLEQVAASPDICEMNLLISRHANIDLFTLAILIGQSQPTPENPR
jgi:hypothetical protein